jgi:hypothetical protein
MVYYDSIYDIAMVEDYRYLFSRTEKDAFIMQDTVAVNLYDLE